MDANDRLRGIATQDHELASIRDCWNKTDVDMKDELLSWLEDEDAGNVELNFSCWPPEWIEFIQQCAACGLRQAVLNEAEAKQD